MTQQREQAAALLRQFKGDRYIFGLGCFARLGEQAAEFGHRVSVVTSGVGKPWGQPIHDATRAALAEAGVQLAGELIPGPKPNAPIEDVMRISKTLAEQAPDAVVAVGGGSLIDAVKAAVSLVALGDRWPNLDDYFGMGQVASMLAETERSLLPIVAVQLASGSAAHLTKYSNITNMQTGQKLLIIDDAVVPPRCLFDYAMTASMDPDFTMDGGLDGVSHCLEVLMGIPQEKYEQLKPVSLLGIELIINNLEAACRKGGDLDAREAIGLGTDLGGYAIMIGGTNGAHLTSFSLVDLLSHGRACALMNPYYVVFFAPVIEDRLRAVGEIYRRAGYGQDDLDRLSGRALGEAVARAMLAQSRAIGFPTRLTDVPGFSPAHIQRALGAAKNPKLESKLKNMPVPLTADQVDAYMGPVLQAAVAGDFSLIKNMD